jgi:hypothetical protein
MSQWDVANSVKDIEAIGAVPHRPRLMPLKGWGMTAVLTLLVVGLSSFFLPLIRVSPAVMNQTEWSPFETLLGLLAGSLHFEILQNPFFFPLAPIEIAAVYLAMLSTLFLVLARVAQQFTLSVAFFVASLFLAVGRVDARSAYQFLALREKFGVSFTYDLECIFYNGASQHLPGQIGRVDCSELLNILLCISVILALIAFRSWLNDWYDGTGELPLRTSSGRKLNEPGKVESEQRGLLNE